MNGLFSDKKVTSYGGGATGTTYPGYISPQWQGQKNIQGQTIGGSGMNDAMMMAIMKMLGNMGEQEQEKNQQQSSGLIGAQQLPFIAPQLQFQPRTSYGDIISKMLQNQRLGFSQPSEEMKRRFPGALW